MDRQTQTAVVVRSSGAPNHHATHAQHRHDLRFGDALIQCTQDVGSINLPRRPQACRSNQVHFSSISGTH